MEDSEKRRERLKAMRMEADQAEASSFTNATAVSGFLSNPLLEGVAPAEETPFSTPRFDYYTDPMAAFSSNKRSGSGKQAAQEYFRPPSNSSSPAAQFSSPTQGSWNHRMPPSPVHQVQNYYSPYSSMTSSPACQMQNYHSPYAGIHPAKGPYHNAASQGSPGSTPFPVHQGLPHPRAESGHLVNNYASQRGSYSVNEGHPGFQSIGSSTFSSRQVWPSNNPNRGSGYHPGRGQGQWCRGGGGRSQFSGPRGGRGRGRGSHSHGTAPDEASKPESFYDESMFEDPWQNLEPVVWKGQDASGSSGFWLPGSISTKKARVSQPSMKLNSQQSLAEYLAASFNEAANNSPSV